MNKGPMELTLNAEDLQRMVKEYVQHNGFDLTNHDIKITTKGGRVYDPFLVLEILEKEDTFSTDVGTTAVVQKKPVEKLEVVKALSKSKKVEDKTGNNTIFDKKPTTKTKTQLPKKISKPTSKEVKNDLFGNTDKVIGSNADPFADDNSESQEDPLDPGNDVVPEDILEEPGANEPEEVDPSNIKDIPTPAVKETKVKKKSIFD